MYDEYKKAIENTNIVSKTDINGIITFVNDEFCKLCGYTKEELIGKNHNIIRHPDTPQSDFKKLWDTILSKKVHKGIVKNKAKNGKAFWAQTTIIPIIFNDEIMEFIAIRHDVTELFITKDKLEKLNNNLSKEVQKQTKKLQTLNNNLIKKVKEEVQKNAKQQNIIFMQNRQVILGQMLENIAHQWRQPLNELSMNLFLLQQNNDKKYYKQAQKLILNMSQTINDFNDFIKVKENKEKTKVVFLIKKALQITYQSLKKNNIKLIFDIKQCNLNLSIEAYANELIQVFLNLINNAKDALEQSNKNDKYLKIVLKNNKQNITLSFFDNATGVDENIINDIFDPYFTTKHKSKGVGLGLFICKQILNKISATLNCYNHKDGACFEIVFIKEKE
ncbi:PAS domain-containing sensor histidine kinase [Campylobacter canadensis]|uniref:histidine kinase n=1 Tax=Campylobacter canadensis TaxID=449520 RepID=A0ABS7WTN2_9BACT|nr:PAS domain-containing sensor histidine kinase [Campylobacter canadensis]MBZ7988136.1 PAS domain-containing sensor histidine kinase [Campylobacter canadensis]MBZ7995552.1 PAS domain-containing sensor histidine kinase [Campylobacter canadensis]MBZ7997370.1 PAS domain-containing sensor histidine kinase [Campylobacter canadensis]MBZ7999115.1 PAS domain-containing sensor histidine kinase [Campylobacter canadensis]MBZ8000930.1 PAS domain-containing sensor histidine kinase [Campylobacter canadensi